MTLVWILSETCLFIISPSRWCFKMAVHLRTSTTNVTEGELNDVARVKALTSVILAFCLYYAPSTQPPNPAVVIHPPPPPPLPCMFHKTSRQPCSILPEILNDFSATVDNSFGCGQSMLMRESTWFRTDITPSLYTECIFLWLIPRWLKAIIAALIEDSLFRVTQNVIDSEGYGLIASGSMIMSYRWHSVRPEPRWTDRDGGAIWRQVAAL